MCKLSKAQTGPELPNVCLVRCCRHRNAAKTSDIYIIQSRLNECHEQRITIITVEANTSKIVMSTCGHLHGVPNRIF